MLGSEHEGECATSAQMASAMLKAMGLTWSEVIRRGLGAETSRQAHQGPALAHETQAPQRTRAIQNPGVIGPGGVMTVVRESGARAPGSATVFPPGSAS